MTTAEENAFAERLRLKIEAYHETALVHAAVKLGLPDRLAAGPASAEHLAAALGLCAPHLYRFLRGLCIVGICAERADGTFALAPGGRCLKSDSPSRLAEKVQIVVGQYWQPWADLISTLETGDPAFDRAFGTNVFDWRREHAEQGALFAAYLAEERQADTKAIHTTLGISPSDKVVECDGANVTWLADIPAGGDFYLLRGVLQNYDDETAAAILRNCRTAMPNGAKLVIVERLMPNHATNDPAAIMLDLHMMTITGGRARTLAEFETLLLQTGFGQVQATGTASGLTIIAARR